MATTFELALLRLKEQLQVQGDKEVAAMLGLSPTAFNERKRRDAFPEEKLIAFFTNRSEAKLDVTYVLTGERVSDWQREQFALTAKTLLEMEPAGDGPLHQSLLEAVKTVGKQQTVRQPDFDRLQEVLSHHDDDEYKMVMDQALMLAERLRGLRARQAGVAVKKAAKKAA